GRSPATRRPDPLQAGQCYDPRSPRSHAPLMRVLWHFQEGVRSVARSARDAQVPFRKNVKLTPRLSQEGIPHSERLVWRLRNLSPAWPGLFAIDMSPQATP